MLSPFDPIGLTRTEIDRLTYRQAWEWYVEPNLKKKDSGNMEGARGTVSPGDMNSDEANAFFDKLCKSKDGTIRKYEGKRWWLGEDPNIKIYKGPGK